MIAPKSMYLDQLRSTFRHFLAITLGVALTSAIILVGVRDWGGLGEQLVYQLIISVCVGSLFWLTIPPIKSYADRLGTAARWTVKIIAAALILNFGISIGF